MNEENVIKVETPTRVFNHSLVAINHISFSVKREEIFLLDPNGARSCFSSYRHGAIVEISKQVRWLNYERCC